LFELFGSVQIYEFGFITTVPVQFGSWGFGYPVIISVKDVLQNSKTNIKPRCRSIRYRSIGSV